MSKRAFAIACHPDDLEFGMMGTMMLLKDAGYEVHYMNVSTGSLGTDHHDYQTIVRMRREEALNSAKLVGAVFHESICDDIEVFYNYEILAKLVPGVREVEPEKQKLIQTLGGSKKDELTKIVLPSSVPLILSIMKVNIGVCRVGVVIGEFIGARCGLGYLIIYGSQTFKLTWVLMSIVILCVIAMVLYAMLDLIEKYTLKK